MCKPETELFIDLRKTISNLNDNIAKNQNYQNDIWFGLLKLVITLSSSMLILSLVFVEKIFNTIPVYIILSWLFFYLSIIFGIISFIYTTIDFNNYVLKQSAKRDKYVRLLAEKKELPYKPETHSDLMVYFNPILGEISLITFFVAVDSIVVALLNKVINNCYCIIIFVVLIFVTVIVAFLLHYKRKTKTTELR